MAIPSTTHAPSWCSRANTETMQMIIREPACAYHARTDRLSKGMLDLIAKSPAHLRASLDGAPRKPTPATEFGTAVHAAVLEPDTLAVRPKLDRRTKAGKTAAKEFAATANDSTATGMLFVDEDTYSRAMAARDGVMRHPTARRLLDDGIPEQTALGEIYGIEVKCRPDWYRPSAGVIVDLKTTADASPDAFARSCANYRYHVQAAWYLDVCEAAGIEAHAFVFIAVESSPPYEAAVYVLDQADVEIGRRTYEHDLETYRRCLESGEWPGYSEHIEVLKLPAWAKPKQPREEY